MLNIFLIPYTWLRHFSMALWCGVAGLLAWWVVLTGIVWFRMDWPPTWDGPILMCAVSSMVAAASVIGEANLRRLPILGRLWRTAAVAGGAAGATLVWYFVWHLVVARFIFSDETLAPDAADPSLVSLTFRLGSFAMGGLGCGSATLVIRRFQGVAAHLGGGIAAGLAGAMAWHLLGSNYQYFQGDLYLAGAGLGLTWGFVFGLLSWGIPDELYTGWIRVLTPYRYGRRIPVDALDGSPKERFVGHFPRGLDLFLPIEEGAQELHVSVAVDEKRRYRARGLTLAPTKVRRFLERIDLRYDSRRPAPLETRLNSGDRITLGEGQHQSQLEFLMLPREER